MQAAGRVGFFLHVEDFDAAYARMASAGVQFLTASRTEPYGCVAVFLDIAGNKLRPAGLHERHSRMSSGSSWLEGCLLTDRSRKTARLDDDDCS
jgi:hypothetical protein